MKKLNTKILAILLIAFTINFNAQNEDNPWMISAGATAIDIYPVGTHSQQQGENLEDFFNISDHWNIGAPYLSVRRYLAKDISFGLSGTLNNIENWGRGGSPADYSAPLDVDGDGQPDNIDLNFYSLSGSFNYSFAKLINSKKFEPFIGLGGGYTWIEEGPYNSNNSGEQDALVGQGSVNVSLGASYWFGENWGLTLESTYNHTYPDGEESRVAPTFSSTPIVPQYFRHAIGVSYRFGGKDTDGDGVKDKEDACPGVPGLKAFNGCPDTDGDGIQDSEDNCPELAGIAEYSGCPDTDGDGVSDEKDRCPDVAGLVILGGCPDADGDGITDSKDKCPNVAGVRGNRGCPWPDTDGDSVLDKDDKCPGEAGTVANNGCPEDPSVLINEMLAGLGNVTFDTGKSSLIKDAETLLLEVVAILDAYPETEFVIEGHTDSKFTEAFNQKLSEKRADSVFKFLTDNGIEASRLSTAGFGEMSPTASNDTVEGRSQNRRVEIKLSN